MAEPPRSPPFLLSSRESLPECALDRPAIGAQGTVVLPPDEPALICRLCSKPIQPGTATTQDGEVVVHVRCLARETRLQAMELRSQSAALRVERRVEGPI